MNLDELRRGLHISRLENNLFGGKVACLKSIGLGEKEKGREYTSPAISGTMILEGGNGDTKGCNSAVWGSSTLLPTLPTGKPP